MNRIVCACLGHQYQLKLGPRFMALECTQCGRQTSGITLHQSYRQTQCRKGLAAFQRLMLQKAWMAYRLGDIA